MPDTGSFEATLGRVFQARALRGRVVPIDELLNGIGARRVVTDLCDHHGAGTTTALVVLAVRKSIAVVVESVLAVLHRRPDCALAGTPHLVHTIALAELTLPDVRCATSPRLAGLTDRIAIDGVGHAVGQHDDVTVQVRAVDGDLTSTQTIECLLMWMTVGISQYPTKVRTQIR